MYVKAEYYVRTIEKRRQKDEGADHVTQKSRKNPAHSYI